MAKPWKKVDEETKSVLREIDWNDVIPRILVLTRAEMYKKRSYGLYPLSWKIPEDYVNEAITLFLVGKRVWKHKEVPFLHFLHGSVTSLISHDVEKSYKYLMRVRSSDEESIRQELSTSPGAIEEDIVTEELLKQLRKVLEEDFVCIAIIELVITSGVSKPRELAEELEVPISEIYNAKKRLRRILLEVKEELIAEKPASKEPLMSDINTAKLEVVDSLLKGIYALDEIDLVASLPSDEVKEEARQNGLDVDAIATLASLKVGTAYGIVVEPGSSLISDNAFIRDKPLGNLLDKLGALGYGDSRWISEICSSPKEILVWFEGGATMEEFYSRNLLDDPPEESFKLQILEDFSSEIEVNHICIIGLYPSGALRSLPAAVSRTGNDLLVRIKNPVLFLDPDEPQSIEDIKSFGARVTTFAVRCLP